LKYYIESFIADAGQIIRKKSPEAWRKRQILLVTGEGIPYPQGSMS